MCENAAINDVRLPRKLLSLFSAREAGYGSTCDSQAWIYDGANRTYDLRTPKLTIATVADRPAPVIGIHEVLAQER